MANVQPIYQNHMLIIDSDSPLSARLRALFQAAFKIKVCDSKVTVEDMRSSKLDIIIINRDMPDNFGIELFVELKSTPELTNIPVIFLSSSDDPETEEAAINLGAADYLKVSVDSNVLRARVNSCLLTKHRIERLSFLTTIDSVTRLANRRLFNQYLAREWARAVRLQHPITVIAVELAGLEEVAAQYGDSVSDRCLTHMARVIERCLQRPGDFPARYMDNKILIILPDTDSTGAYLVLGKITSTLEESIGEMLSQSAARTLTVRSGLESIKPDRSSSLPACIRSVMMQLKLDSAQPPSSPLATGDSQR